MNLVANPITSRSPDGPLRVIIIERNHRRDPILPGPGPAFYGVREKLNLVYYGAIKTAMYCNTASWAESSHSLEEARRRVAENDIDLVLVRDFNQISDWLDEVESFIRHCAEKGTRVVAFDDGFDTADADWEKKLLDAMLEDLFSSPADSESD